MPALDTATLTTYLNEARTAYHALVTGRSARVVVDQNGERVEYTAANRAALKAYIDELEGLLGEKTTTGPMKVFF